ncbi:hypothetical protein GCK32_000915 [Trichostrongylus colubriformis]|uniref:K Homology domain-containing protein n=1 Tax=Trichostrongylus colubriformis TaxID=6319 RepID=A0AAN8IW95_TRICO
MHGPARKKSRVEDDDILVSVVILIPSIAVGSLIGQNATIMSNLKNEYECIMQKAICLIGIIVEKISECCQGSFDTDQFDFTQVDRANEIKILIPDSSAAVLAEEIKNIRENGSMIQIFYKATEAHSQERIVTLAHDNHRQLLEATRQMVQVVAADNRIRNIIENHFGVKGGPVSQPSVHTMFLNVIRRRSGVGSNGHNPAAALLSVRRVTREFVEYTLPDTWVGLVVGSKARTLQKIKEYGGCKLEVFKREEAKHIPENTRLIKISGDKSDILLGRYLIERLINDAIECKEGAGN